MKKLFIVLVSLLVLFGCSTMPKESHPKDASIVQFWKYVSDNQAKIFAANANDPSIYGEITERIHLIDENIMVFIGNEIIGNKKELVISSAGNPEYFELCDRMVKIAPKFAHLKPVSLIQPVKKIEPFIIGDIVLRVEDVQVNIAGSDNNISLLFALSEEHTSRIMKDGYDSGQLYPIYLNLLHLMTQQILGERIVGTRIQSAIISPVSAIEPSVPITKLNENLPAVKKNEKKEKNLWYDLPEALNLRMGMTETEVKNLHEDVQFDKKYENGKVQYILGMTPVAIFAVTVDPKNGLDSFVFFSSNFTEEQVLKELTALFGTPVLRDGFYYFLNNLPKDIKMIMFNAFDSGNVRVLYIYENTF